VLGVRQDTTKKGTTVTNKYQKNTPKASAGPGLAVPDEVTVAMGEIAEDMREGLLALAVGAGLQVMSSLMEADVATACGPRGKHDPERTAVRHGSERGSVTLGGRRVGVQRPRMRATGGGEVPVPAYDLFSRSEILGRMAMSKMLGGLSSRRYTVGLEPVGEKVERAASATSKSAVSRRFVAMTETALGSLIAGQLSGFTPARNLYEVLNLAQYWSSSARSSSCQASMASSEKRSLTDSTLDGSVRRRIWPPLNAARVVPYPDRSPVTRSASGRYPG